MPLAEVQRALAHLYTDDASRELLRTDATSFAATFALDAGDFAQVASMGEARLQAYTDSLDRKRAQACLRELPLTTRCMGPRFRSEFLRFARRVPLGDGEHRYRDDANAFARHLAARSGNGLSAAVLALLAYESHGTLGIRSYRFDVRKLARAVELGEPIDAIGPRATIVVRPWARREFAFYP